MPTHTLHTIGSPTCYPPLRLGLDAHTISPTPSHLPIEAFPMQPPLVSRPTIGSDSEHVDRTCRAHDQPGRSQPHRRSSNPLVVIRACLCRSCTAHSHPIALRLPLSLPPTTPSEPAQLLLPLAASLIKSSMEGSWPLRTVTRLCPSHSKLIQVRLPQKAAMVAFPLESV